ncbi:MAG: type II toxin-antitoxin system VapC family toxin [Thermodesulfobacteriota bacterium]|nr:type II toxin-antitoxin system VapC family toxin [Thermodesulfobacteriota bacterium]
MILLDTHIWVRWLISEDIGSELIELIENAEEACVSSISCWEVVLLANRGRIALSASAEQWINTALYEAQTTCLPIDRQTAVLAANLPDHHRDPADRIIIATAIINGAQVISFDKQFRKYDELKGLLLPS